MALHVHNYGPPDGHALLALHNMSGDGGAWSEVAGLLAGFRVLAPDLRGFGRSSPEPPWTFDYQVADLLATIDAARVDRVDVVGHSLGGSIAVQLARHAQERVRRLVLLDPGIGVPPLIALAGARAATSPVTATLWSESARPAVVPPSGVPTLLVLAMRGRNEEFEYVAEWRAAGGDLTVKHLDCGHAIPRERPAETADLIREFLSAPE
ncbi:MAG: alpha/beta fold hydrolase [Hamadaea sp.]|uniref:alpha/beta fold hydrolase n=1 Tax=Hamadaea sp. TaxID=2024425 RepID=UPI0017EBA593|nr:alpha/beta fold hydrolase [Hamadaea sp.]NUR69411.1 alpha/beta fold hydrolase [Hamadaea sp.]NUT23826.1 alpha/beta fold hydrolase [Hamadaea sp.]